MHKTKEEMRLLNIVTSEEFASTEQSKYQYYLRRVAILTDHFAQLSRSRDKTIVLISTASIAASIALLGSLLGNTTARPPLQMLFVSWTFLVFAPIAVVLAHSISMMLTSCEKKTP
jgi:hypothetical protein